MRFTSRHSLAVDRAVLRWEKAHGITKWLYGLWLDWLVRGLR